MDIKQSGPGIPPVQFGKRDDSPLAVIILADIAKSSFVIARIQLRPDFFLLHLTYITFHLLHLTYITFHLIHHSIETYLKAFLKKIDGDFPHEHSLINLRNLVVKKTIPSSLEETLQSDEVSKFLATLDGAYAGGKYGEMVASGFDVDDLRKIYDVLMREFIVSFF